MSWIVHILINLNKYNLIERAIHGFVSYYNLSKENKILFYEPKILKSKVYVTGWEGVRHPSCPDRV